MAMNARILTTNITPLGAEVRIILDDTTQLTVPLPVDHKLSTEEIVATIRLHIRQLALHDLNEATLNALQGQTLDVTEPERRD